jgi:hypothetical protein
VWRLDEATWAAAAANGKLNVEVLQATDVKFAGHALPLVEESPFVLCTSRGAQVPTARVSYQNYKLTGRTFDWSDRACSDGARRLSAASDPCSWRVVLADSESRTQPPVQSNASNGITGVTFTALRRSTAILTLSDWDMI